MRTIFIDSGLDGEARWVDAQAGGARDDEDPARRWWPSTLYGPGWTAAWLANRPVCGATRFSGYRGAAISYDSPTLVVGTVTAVRGNWADVDLTNQTR